MAKSYDYIAFGDGFWINSQNGGVGGFILSKTLSVLYIFAGPMNTESALEMEIEACKHIWLALRDKVKNLNGTDSKNVEAKAGLKDSKHQFDKIEEMVALLPSCAIKYVNRILIKEADLLAK